MTTIEVHVDEAGGTRLVGQADQRDLFNRVVASVALGNTDDHLRNHAFLMLEPGQYRLSPAFDIVPHIEAAGRPQSIGIGEFGPASTVANALSQCGRFLLTQSEATRPTAIATASDQQAIGLLRAADDMGLRVPSDLSIVGFDDIPLASLVLPRLTTIRQPIDEIARLALEGVLGSHALQEEYKLQPKLMKRGSCAAPSTR